MKSISSSYAVITLGAIVIGITLFSSQIQANGSNCRKSSMSVSHQDGPRERGPHGMDPNQILFMLDEKLDLSEEQRTEIGKVIDQHNPQLRELKFKMKDGKEAGRDIVESGEFDEAVVQQHATEQSEILSNMIVLKLRMGYGIHSHLSSEQKTQLEEMRHQKNL